MKLETEAVRVSWGEFFGDDPHAMRLECPRCGHQYQHRGRMYVVEGNDNYEAWNGRGDMTVIEFWSECSSEWDLCFGYHKGETWFFTRVRTPCASWDDTPSADNDPMDGAR